MNLFKLAMINRNATIVDISYEHSAIAQQIYVDFNTSTAYVYEGMWGQIRRLSNKHWEFLELSDGEQGSWQEVSDFENEALEKYYRIYVSTLCT